MRRRQRAGAAAVNNADLAGCPRCAFGAFDSLRWPLAGDPRPTLSVSTMSHGTTEHWGAGAWAPPELGPGWIRLSKLRVPPPANRLGKHVDHYYIAPDGKKLRSMLECRRYLGELPTSGVADVFCLTCGSGDDRPGNEIVICDGVACDAAHHQAACSRRSPRCPRATGCPSASRRQPRRLEAQPPAGAAAVDVSRNRVAAGARRLRRWRTWRRAARRAAAGAGGRRRVVCDVRQEDALGVVGPRWTPPIADADAAAAAAASRCGGGAAAAVLNVLAPPRVRAGERAGIFETEERAAAAAAAAGRRRRRRRRCARRGGRCSGVRRAAGKKKNSDSLGQSSKAEREAAAEAAAAEAAARRGGAQGAARRARQAPGAGAPQQERGLRRRRRQAGQRDRQLGLLHNGPMWKLSPDGK